MNIREKNLDRWDIFWEKLQNILSSKISIRLENEIKRKIYGDERNFNPHQIEDNLIIGNYEEYEIQD
jgi:hypothetical protein